MRPYVSLVLVAGLLSLTACAASPPPASSAAPALGGGPRSSADGHFVARVTSTPAVPPINEMHTWTVHVEDANGVPVEGATIEVDGDMPAHGHGLPTQPRVTEYLGDGDYLVEGMKFQMGGDWFVEFSIAAGGVEDVVRFDFTL